MVPPVAAVPVGPSARHAGGAVPRPPAGRPAARAPRDEPGVARQSDAEFRDTRGARLRAAAENIANTAPVRSSLRRPTAPASLLSFYPEQTQRTYLASAVYLTRPDGTIAAGTNPEAVGDRIDLTASTVTEGRSWTGDVDDRGRRSIAAQVPVIDNRGRQVGIAMVAEAYLSIGQRLVDAAPDLLSFVALGLGLGSSAWLLARLIKRRTRWPRAGRDRGAGRPAGGTPALDPRRRRRGRQRRGGHRAQRQRAGAARPARRCRGAALADLPLSPRCATRCSTTSDVRDAVLTVAGRVVAQPQTGSSTTAAGSGPSPPCATAPSCSPCRAS